MCVCMYIYASFIRGGVIGYPRYSPPGQGGHLRLDDSDVGVLGTGGCGAASLISTHHIPGAPPQSSHPKMSVDIASVPWRSGLLPLGNPWVTPKTKPFKAMCTRF